MSNFEIDSKIYDVIRRNIKKYRKAKGMTSAQLAELVNLSHDFIRQIQSEKAKYNFSIETLYKISVALGVSLDKLIKMRLNKSTPIHTKICGSTSNRNPLPK